jgi:hypothetical protein
MIDSGFIWMGKGHGFAILVLASCAEAGSHNTHTETLIFLCCVFGFDD